MFFWFLFSFFSLCFFRETKKTLVNTQKRGNRSACIQVFVSTSSSFSFLQIHKKKSKRWPRKTASLLVHPKIPPFHHPSLQTKPPSQQPHVTSPHPKIYVHLTSSSPIFSSLLEILKATKLLLHLRPPSTRPHARPQSSSLPRQQARPAEPQR